MEDKGQDLEASTPLSVSPGMEQSTSQCDSWEAASVESSAPKPAISSQLLSADTKVNSVLSLALLSKFVIRRGAKVILWMKNYHFHISKDLEEGERLTQYMCFLPLNVITAYRYFIV